MSTRHLHHIDCSQCGVETLHVACRCSCCNHLHIKSSAVLTAAGMRQAAKLPRNRRAKRPAFQFGSSIRNEVLGGRIR